MLRVAFGFVAFVVLLVVDCVIVGLLVLAPVGSLLIAVFGVRFVCFDLFVLTGLVLGVLRLWVLLVIDCCLRFAFCLVIGAGLFGFRFICVCGVCGLVVFLVSVGGFLCFRFYWFG